MPFRVAGLLFASLLGACSLTLPVARDATGEESLRRMSPLARLGRWNGERFVEVGPGELAPSHLRVLVHGWTPGIDRIAARNGLRVWERAGDDALEGWMAELARMFVAEDPHAIVVAYSWLDDSTTRRHMTAERAALAHARQHGGILATAIEEGLSDDFSASNGSIHLIGHSYGARVVAAAASVMAVRPVQLTLFDGPDGSLVTMTGSQTQLRELLAELPIGWGAGRVFVDNYVSMAGTRYAHLPALEGMVDVVLAPPFGALAYGPRHVYPMRFYAESPGTGFGYDWSPLARVGRPPRGIGCWEQIAEAMIVRLGCTGVP